MSRPLFDDIVQISVVVGDVDACVAKYRELLNLQDWHINYVDTTIGKGHNFRKGDNPIVAKKKLPGFKSVMLSWKLLSPGMNKVFMPSFCATRAPAFTT